MKHDLASLDDLGFAVNDDAFGAHAGGRAEAVGRDDAEAAPPSWLALLMMGVGTSIDAGVVGVGMGMAEVEILATAAVIGIVTFGFSFVGVLCGRCVGRCVGACAQVLGGLVLVAIGGHILMAHLGF